MAPFLPFPDHFHAAARSCSRHSLQLRTSGAPQRRYGRTEFRTASHKECRGLTSVANLHRRYRCAHRPIHPARATSLHPFRQRRGVHSPGSPRLDRRRWYQDCLRRTGVTLGERILRKLQCPFLGRTAQRRNLLHAQGGAHRHRAMAGLLQHRAATQLIGISATSPKTILPSPMPTAYAAGRAIQSQEVHAGF